MNSKTMFYIVKRLILAIVTVLVVVTVTFWAMQAIPGGPFNLDKALSEEAKEALNKLYGLDQPLFIQYVRYLGNALTWNFGYSLKSRGAISVLSMIGDGIPYSLASGVCAAAIAIVFGVVLGSIAALKHNKAADRAIMVLSTASVAMPSFVIASILTCVFSEILLLVPVGNDAGAIAYVLPVVTMSLSPMCYITRLTRSSTLDVLGADYIRTAQAKGVSRNKVLFKHALRNSLTPVITYAGPMMAYIITGSIVVEKIFSVKGVGRVFINCINTRDYPVIMGTTIFLTFLMVIMVLISDILYKVVNPRVEFE